ncbi:hypothetical protein ACIBQ3_22395 [Streptomyces rubiginosohelvolus]|uniref:hypothetical protein n=1 Tax=Streptomyces rubiginosohelvolus TaxID=67362 RepID=UPI0037B75D64
MPKAEQLRYAVDVTAQDVTAIEAFFAAQLPDRHADTGPRDTSDYRARHALRTAVSHHIQSIRARMSKEGIEHALTAWQWDMKRAHEISSRWCDLVDMVREWSGTEGFDDKRWVHRQSYQILPGGGTSPDEETTHADARAAEGDVDAFVSEFTIPRQQSEGAYAVVRDPGLSLRWALFEDGTRERHWDGASWQPTGAASSPYHFSRPAALAIARQHAAAAE